MFLTIFSSISRMSNAVCLGPSLQEHRDSLVLHFVSLKSRQELATPGVTFRSSGFPRILSFVQSCFNKATSDNYVLSDYILVYFQVSGIRGDWNSFFVFYVAPHKTSTTLWGPHAVRSAASAHQSAVRQLDLGQICLADWSLSSGVLHKFYNRYANRLLYIW